MPSGKRPHKHGASWIAPPPPSHNAPAPSSLKGIAAILHDESPHGLYAILQRALGCSEWQGEGSAGLSLPRAVRAVTIVKLLEPNERDKIILPSYEMCKLLHEHGGAWPKEPTDLDKDTSLLRSRVFLTEERRRETLDKCWRLIFQLSRECDSSERMEWSVLMQPNVQKAEDWCGAGDWKEIKDAADEAKDGNAMRLRLESNASLSADLVKRAARVWLFLHPIKRCTTIACDLLFHNVPDAVKSTIKARSSLDLVERLCSKADSALSLHNTVDRGTLEHARLRLLCYKLISWRRDPSTLCEYLLHPPETRKLVEFASPVLGAIQRLTEDYPTEIISTLGPPRLTLLFDALANDFDLAAFGLKSGTRSNPYLTRSRPLLKEIFSNVFVNCHRNAGLMRDEYISLQDLLANLSSLPATVSSTASSGPTMVASHSSGGISRSQAVVRCAADADVKQSLLEVCVATLNTDGQKLEVFEIAVESERILRESSLSERASNDLLSDPYSVDIQLQHRLLKSDRFLAFTGHKLLQGHSAMTLKFELDTDVLEYSIASSQLDDPVKLSLPRSQTYSSRSADGLSATIVLGLRFKLPDNSKSTFRSRVRDFIKLIKNKNKSSKANAAALSVDAVSMLAAISAYTLLRTSGRATQTQNDVVESLLQNPIFTEMMPASLRHLVDQEQNRLKLSDEFWSSRLKRSRDMPVDETNLLMMVLSEDKMDSSRRLLVLDEKDFTRLLHVCQAESWDTWRPVIVRLTLARSNLAAMTARLRELEQSCCFTVAFLSLGEPISASAMARFVHPFLGDAGSLRIVLQHSPALINNLRSTDLAAHIFAPTLHSSRTTAMVSSPAVDFAKDSPLALLFRMTDSLLDQMTGMSLRDWKAIEERNRNLDSWRESLLQWLLSVPNDGGAAFQQQHSTPETNATTTMEVGQPNLSAKVAVVVQRDAVVTDRLIRGVEEAARHTKSLPVALGHPVLLDCGDVDFFERLATLQLSTRRERRKKMVWAVLRRSHLLGAEERLTAVRTLVREGIKTIVVLSSLIPLSELDRFDTNSNCIFNFSHYVPPSLRTEDIGGENDDLDSSTLQEPATPASARLDEASGAPDCSRVLWICWTLLGRHVTLPLSDMLTKSQPGTVFNKMDFTDVGVPEHLLDGVLVICQAVFDSAFSEQPRAQGAGRATQVTIWLKSLVDLLVQNWGVGCDTPARLLSFDQFYATASCAQVLHHHNCLRLWAYTFLHVAIASDQREGERISAVLKGLDSLLPTLPNISGLSLLETLCLPSSASSSLDANIKYAARGSIADFEEGGVCTAVLQIATRGEELPWNELGVPFRQSPPSLTAFLDALAMCSHPLRFIMQLDARVLDSVLQGAEERTLQQLTRCLMPIAMEKSSSPLPSALPHLHLIDNLFHVCDWSLERIPAAFSALSIAYFHATKATNFFEQLCDARITLSNKHTAVVLRAGVHFRVGDSPTQWPPLLRVLIQLDSPPLLLIQQAEVAARLIVGSREELEEKVLKNAPKYGLCLLQAILHSSVRNTNSILRQTLLARFVYQLLDMTDEEKPVSVEDISSFDGEFSPAFVALLLSLLSSHCAADLLATTVIERAKRAYGNDSASVSTYIADCVMTNGELVQPQLSVLYFLRSCGSLDFPDAKHEALRVLWSVAFLQTDNLEKLVGAWSHLSPSDEARSPSTTNGLPLEADGMTSLHDAVLQHWCNSVSPVPLADGVIKVGKRDVARLSHSAQVALLRYMTQRLVNGSEPIVNFQAMHAIVALLWVHNPEQELPLRPDAIDGSPCRLDNATFVLINRLKVEFPMRTRALGPLGCSTLGKWFVLPHLLPLPLLITFNQAFHKYTPMPETKTFLLGQKHDDRVFYISVHEQKSDGRMMWQRVAESLKLEKVCELDTLLTFAPCQWNIVVDNGFDEDLMRTNFRVLLAAHHRRQAERCASYPNFSPKTRGVEVTNANVRYMYNLVCAWFAALKVSLSVLCKTIKETLGDEYLEQPLWSSSTLDSFLAQPCYTPVPSALDVHERSSLSLVRYFGPSQHDRALTLQALCSFLPADKAPGITIAATERHNYDQLWHRAVLALVESLNETLAEERVSVFAHLIKAMYQEAGEARKVAEPMLKDMVQRTKEWHNTNTNTNTNTLPRVFRWLIRGIGFSNGSGGLDRGVAVADQPDETGLIMLKLALKEWSVREPHDCCDITLREARSFLLKTHLSEGAKSDATGIAQVLDSLGEAVQRVDSRKPDRVTDLDFSDKTTRHKCEQLLMGSVADGAPSCDSSELGRVESGGMSRTVDACGRHGSVPSLLHPLSVDDGQSKAASGAAVDVAQRASSRLSMMDLQEGIISFSFGDKNERNFVVQARSLVRRRSVSSDKWNTEISLCADVIEVIDGPGGALVKDVADGYDVFETCSTYQLLSKAELLNTNFFLPSQGRRHDNAVRQKVPLVTFPSNLLAWRFLVNNLPENAIVVGDGIVLKKSQTTKQLCPIAVNLEADSDCIADAFVLGPMLNYFGLVSEYYDFLSVLVAMALYSGQGPISAPEAPCSSLSEEDQLYKWVGDQLWKHANACQDDKVTVASMLRGKLGELSDHVEQSRRLISSVASGEAAPELDAEESDSSEAFGELSDHVVQSRRHISPVASGEAAPELNAEKSDFWNCLEQSRRLISPVASGEAVPELDAEKSDFWKALIDFNEREDMFTGSFVQEEATEERPNRPSSNSDFLAENHEDMFTGPFGQEEATEERSNGPSSNSDLLAENHEDMFTGFEWETAEERSNRPSSNSDFLAENHEDMFTGPFGQEEATEERSNGPSSNSDLLAENHEDMFTGFEWETAEERPNRPSSNSDFLAENHEDMFTGPFGQEEATEELSNGPSSNSDFLEESTLRQWLPSHLVNETVRDVLRNGLAVSQSTSSHDKLLEMILLGGIPERFKAKNMLGVSSADEAKNFGLLSEESRVQGWGDGQIRSDVKLFSCLRVERDERFIPPGLANMVCEVRTHHAGEMVFVRCGANQRQDGAAQHAFGYILRNDTLNGRLANMSADLHAWICACITAPVANETIRWMLRLVLSHEYQLPELLNASEQLRHAIVAFSLADTYPNRDEEQSHVLREYTRLPHGVDEFVRHTSSVYGLFVCSVATRYLLSERLFPVDFVNVALLRKQGLTSDDQLYRHIVRTFSSATLIVYVHGVRRISDALLKWCAEYTKAVPFHYIYFEELDTDRNFSEIRDRCNFDHFVRPTLVELEYAMAHPADHDDDATSAPPSIENVNYVDPDSTTPDSNDDQSGWLMLGSSTNYRGDWKKQLKELLRCTEANVGGGLQQSLVKLRAMIVISPPGAGKTSYMEKVVSRLWAKDAKEYGGQFQYFDASNSVLVEEALVSLLARQCGREGRLWLVVDEYHMLTERQKFQLFQFLSVRSQEHNVRTIFYGNRMEKHDVDLVKAWQCGSARVDIFRCRLPAMHIRGLVLQERPKALPDDPMRRTAVIEQLHWWCGVIRALFSDDVLTFRNRETLIEVLAAGPVVSELAKVLHDKAPQLGVLTTERVAFHMLQFFRRFGQTLALNPQKRSTEFARTVCVLANERDTDPMSLLVRTALVSATAASLSYPPISVEMLMSEGFINVNLDNSDVEDDPEPNGYTFMSFPEYTSQAPYSARFHPTFRLQSWVRYVFSNAHQRVSEKDAMLKIELPDVAVLQRLVVIDQPDFPLVTAIGVQRQPLACGRAFAEHGDYTDLKWIQSNLQRSAAISWHKASVEWSRCFISSVPDLLNLLEVCPDQQACLNAVAPVNLCSLMAMTIGEKHGNDLAERVVRLASRKFVEQEIGPSNPLLHATWLLYVRCDKHVLQRVGDDAQLRRGMLLWASRYGTEMLQVPMTEESELVQMNKRLSEDVYCAMCQLVGEDREGSGQARSNVVTLFTGVFAELAPDPRFASAHALGNVEKQKLTHKAALWLAESQYPAHRKWPSGLEQLTRVMHGCEGVTSELLQEMCLWHAFRVDNRDGDPDVGSATLIGLLKDEEFAQALERGRVCLPEDELMQGVLARGMLREDSHLVVPKPWQLAFLTQLHKPWLAPIKVKQLLESPDFLKRTFFDGLCTLRKSNEIWPGAAWHDIEARKVLQDHFRHLHGCDDRSTRRDATTLMMERAKAELEERRRASLKVVSRLLRVEHPGILAYYNQTLGAAALREELKKKTVVQDEYKNPRGAHFDLAREKAFDGFHVLLGDFSVEYGFLMMKCRSDKEANFILENLRKKGDMMRDFDYVRDGLQIGLSPQHHRRQECRTLFPSDTLWDPVVYRRHLKTKNLKENIESRLGLKGFQLHIVCDEMEFVNKLKSGKFQVAWVISGPEVDVVRRCENQARRVEVLAETLASACLSFNRQRGGLFVFGENDPHFWHANVVLRALTGGKMHLAGNIPGGSFVAAEGVTAPDGTMQSCGQFSVTPDHVLMTGIQVLYEGETVAVPQNIPRNWKTVVTGGFPANKGPKEAKSLVVVNEGNFGDHRGRVVVDVGFTKLWLEWEKGGTDRYVANATAWLTGVDMHFVGLKADAPGPSSESLRKLALAPSLSSIPLPQLLNKVTLTPPSDVCVILDLSGSMWSYKDQAVRFAQQLCQDTLKRNPDNRMALIPFGSDSEVFAHFQCGSTTFDEGANRIRNLRHSFGLTAYSKPLKMAISSLHWRPKEAARRLVIFQTDGYPNADDRSRFPHVARELVNEAHATVVGVVVTENSEMAKSMVSLVVGYAGDYDNRNGFYKEDLVIHVSDYNALVQKIGGIAQQAMSTM